MPTVTVNSAAYSVESGTRISDLPAFKAIATLPCGGHGRCGKCRVRAVGALSPPSDAEKRALTPEEIAAGIRLACCATIEGDCDLTVAEDSLSRIRVSGDMPAISPSPIFDRYGAAIDIGTTTMAARLYDRAGSLLAEAGCPNPQGAFGADVISRIEAALVGNAAAIARSTRKALDELIGELATAAQIDTYLIDGLVITGNTVMLHLLTETSTEPLSHAPFAAKRLFDEVLTAGELKLSVLRPQTQIYLPPCVAAFVGADLLCALLASDICKTTAPQMLVDIGTNGEMALWHESRLFCCSTAAGPAFEGAGISMGMSGKIGAIDHVSVQNGKMHAHVIGDSSPKGICGSGVIDAIACLIELELLDETGSLEDDPLIVSPPVYLTQNDVRMIQLAKSAIHAGIRTLLSSARLDCNALHTLSVAGGFGSYMNIENAGRIGLIPSELTSRVRVIGNAALSGASMLLLDRNCRSVCEQYAQSAQVIDLTSNPRFAEEYMERMLFE